MKNLVFKCLASVILFGIFHLYSVEGASCRGLQGDVVFVLDSSGSVGPTDFQTMLGFVSDLIDEFDIGPSNVRVGLIRYSSSSTFIFDLDDYTTKTSLKSEVTAVGYSEGYTATDDAINLMTTSAFTAARGDRANVPNVGIVITDGYSDSQTRTEYAAFVARAAGITMFAIGVGTGVTELKAIASDPDSWRVFTVANFAGLTSVLATFKAKACIPAVFNGTQTAEYVEPAESSGTTEASGSSTAAMAAGVTVGVTSAAAAVAVAVYLVKAKAAKAAVAAANGGAEVGVGFPDVGEMPSSVQPVDTRLPH